jgi:hypothetical protein
VRKNGDWYYTVLNRHYTKVHKNILDTESYQIFERILQIESDVKVELYKCYELYHRLIDNTEQNRIEYNRKQRVSQRIQREKRKLK